METLRDKVRRAEEGGGRERRERQHREGKLTARERVEVLLTGQETHGETGQGVAVALDRRVHAAAGGARDD